MNLGVEKIDKRLLRSLERVVETAQPIHGTGCEPDEVVISKALFDELAAALREVAVKS